MIAVGVSGAAGNMGRRVCDAVAAADDLELAATYDPAGGTSGERSIATDPAALREVDVVVEFTNPSVVDANLATWRDYGAHAVVGTSGFDAVRVERLQSSWGAGPPNCLVVPNFSIGAVVMMRLAELAAPHFAAGEVIELHHDRKADAPSGTALATASRIGAAQPDQRRAVESAELLAGARGAAADGVPVHSVRLPGLVAHQQVLFGNPGEILTIRHDTTDRSSFVPGVLLAVREVGGLAGGVTVGLEGLLGI